MLNGERVTDQTTKPNKQTPPPKKKKKQKKKKEKKKRKKKKKKGLIVLYKWVHLTAYRPSQLYTYLFKNFNQIFARQSRSLGGKEEGAR